MPIEMTDAMRRCLHREPALKQPAYAKAAKVNSEYKPEVLEKALEDFHTVPMSITITGQVRGGKNAMGINHKTGRHYAKPPFAKWRDAAVREVKGQLPASWMPIETPVNVRLEYVAGDRRRRDFPAICDAVWHVLEKAGFCADDTLLWPAQSTRSYDKENPRITLTIL